MSIERSRTTLGVSPMLQSPNHCEPSSGKVLVMTVQFPEPISLFWSFIVFCFLFTTPIEYPSPLLYINLTECLGLFLLFVQPV